MNLRLQTPCVLRAIFNSAPGCSDYNIIGQPGKEALADFGLELTTKARREASVAARV